MAMGGGAESLEARGGPDICPGESPAVVAVAAALAAVGGHDDDSEVVLPQVASASSSTCTISSIKHYLGGYRNRATGALYHHATTQTDAAPMVTQQRQQQQRSERSSCAAQTEHRRGQAVQIPRDASTQCPRPGWPEDITQGRAMEPSGHCKTGTEVQACREQAAVTIQSCVRGWWGRRAAKTVRLAQAELAEEAAAQEQAAEQRRQQEVQRRTQPRTAADFMLLYDELAVWWGQEQDKIAAAQGLTDEERQSARQVLLAKETKLLQTIDRLKLVAAPIVRAERATKQLTSMAAPKSWQLACGTVVQVATPSTLRAGELAECHRALVAADGSSMDARLGALLAAKYHAKAYYCSLTREIVSLVDREADLLNRGRDPTSLAGLRMRIANRFLEFAQDVRFNPEAAAIQPGAAMLSQQLNSAGDAAAAAVTPRASAAGQAGC